MRLSGWAEPICSGELSPELLQALVRAGDRVDFRARGESPDPSKRLEAMPPYMFQELERRIADKRAAGIDVISLGIGDPDEPTYPAHRRGDAGGGRRPRQPPVPEQPRPRRVPRGLRRLLRPPLRGRDRPRDRGDPGDRRQGVHLQPLLRLPRPGRRRPRLRSRLPGLHRRADPRRRHAGAAAAGARARLRPRPRARCRPRSPPRRG